MKTHSKRLTQLFLLGACGCFISAFAAEGPSPTEKSPKEKSKDNYLNQIDPTSDAVPLGRVEKLSAVTGLVVQDADGQKIGKIDDLGVDVISGRIVQVIVSIGGIAGIGDRHISLPPATLQYESPGVLRVRATEEQIKNSPPFDQALWSEQSKPERIAEVYRHYGTKPYFSVVYETSGIADPSAIRLGPVQKASSIVGMKVKNNPGDTLGTVDTLMVDLPAGRLVAVIVSSGGVLGIGNDLLAMPPALFVVNERNKTLDADITLDTLKGAPHFRASEWPNLGEAEYVETVYQAFNVSPYFRSDKAPKPQALTPLDQGNSKADITVTAEIRKALLREADLSVNGKNAKIITINGKVTLRGAVDNEGERDQIATIAGQIAGAGNVANELVIQPSASKPGKR